VWISKNTEIDLNITRIGGLFGQLTVDTQRAAQQIRLFEIRSLYQLGYSPGNLAEAVLAERGYSSECNRMDNKAPHRGSVAHILRALNRDLASQVLIERGQRRIANRILVGSSILR